MGLKTPAAGEMIIHGQKPALNFGAFFDHQRPVQLFWSDSAFWNLGKSSVQTTPHLPWGKTIKYIPLLLTLKKFFNVFFGNIANPPFTIFYVKPKSVHDQIIPLFLAHPLIHIFISSVTFGLQFTCIFPNAAF